MGKQGADKYFDVDIDMSEDDLEQVQAHKYNNKEITAMKNECL